jgi:hypothetical protein
VKTSSSGHRAREPSSVGEQARVAATYKLRMPQPTPSPSRIGCNNHRMQVRNPGRRQGATTEPSWNRDDYSWLQTASFAGTSIVGDTGLEPVTSALSNRPGTRTARHYEAEPPYSCGFQAAGRSRSRVVHRRLWAECGQDCGIRSDHASCLVRPPRQEAINVHGFGAATGHPQRPVTSIRGDGRSQHDRP